jgi:SAM-dependent methyltransferase
MTAQQFGTWEAAVSWLISAPEQQKVVLDCYYDQPLQAAAERYWCSDEWQAIRSYLPAQLGEALDIGAGHGISSYALAKEGWHVSALEPDPSDLVGVGAIQRLAQEAQLPINVTQEFGEQLPFADSYFDVVFARQVLHHAQDLGQLCREIARVLKPGGILVAVRDHVISSRKDLDKFLERHPLHKFYGGENAFTLKEYTVAIQSAGLQLDQLLRPFDTVINYAPYNKEELRAGFAEKLARLPLMNVPAKLLTSDLVFDSFLKVMSHLDQRPGRVCSFVAQKPLKAVN